MTHIDDSWLVDVVEQALLDFRIKCDMALSERDDNFVTQEEYEEMIQRQLEIDRNKILSHIQSEYIKKCPACVHKVDAYQTKLNEAEFLCDVHSGELNNKLKSIADKEPDEYIKKADVLEAINAEPCEPDCSDVRHAYHQGQWDMELRIKEKLGL